jgi:hypothetical protein
LLGHQGSTPSTSVSSHLQHRMMRRQRPNTLTVTSSQATERPERDYSPKSRDYPSDLRDYPSDLRDYPSDLRDYPSDLRDYPSDLRDAPSYLLDPTVSLRFPVFPTFPDVFCNLNCPWLIPWSIPHQPFPVPMSTKHRSPTKPCPIPSTWTFPLFCHVPYCIIHMLPLCSLCLMVL